MANNRLYLKCPFCGECVLLGKSMAMSFGYEGEGIVHVCHCTNCGAEIEYRISTGGEDGQTA